MDSWDYEILQVEKWWKRSSSDWTMVEYADKQEYMFIQIELLNSPEEDTGEEWKGPNG